MTTWSTLTPREQYATIHAMIDYGGSFARKIAEAMQIADSSNLSRLTAAFDDLIQKYNPRNWE